MKKILLADHLGATMMDINPTLRSTNNIPSGNPGALAAIWAVLDDPAVIEAAQANADGACLKCHVNSTATAGMGITF